MEIRTQLLSKQYSLCHWNMASKSFFMKLKYTLSLSLSVVFFFCLVVSVWTKIINHHTFPYHYIAAAIHEQSKRNFIAFINFSTIASFRTINSFFLLNKLKWMVSTIQVNEKTLKYSMDCDPFPRHLLLHAWACIKTKEKNNLCGKFSHHRALCLDKRCNMVYAVV